MRSSGRWPGAALQQVLEAAMTEAVGAGKKERTPSRLG
jgi:hypothetical protein